jgi:hypothetical protein
MAGTQDGDESIWEEATLNQMLSDPDFEAEFGRERTEEEQIEHEMFKAATILSEPSTQMSVGRDEPTDPDDPDPDICEEI